MDDGTVSAADYLATLSAYGLIDDSELTNAGANVALLYGYFETDYYGTMTPQGLAFDTGADEVVPKPISTATFAMLAVPILIHRRAGTLRYR